MILSMRGCAKKESDKNITRVSDDTSRVEASTTTATPSFSEQRHSVDRALDETRDNIRRTIEETRSHVIHK